MEGGAHPARRFCGLHTIAELEKLLGFGDGARVIARAVEDCHKTPGRCASHFACAERLAAAGAPQAKLETLTRAAAPPATARPAVPRSSASVVPLHAAVPAQTVADEFGNLIERRIISTDVLLARGGHIAELLTYWTALKGEDWIPRFGDIDPVRLTQLGLLGRLHVLNVENPDPLRMRFDLYGTKLPFDEGRIYTGLTVGDHPVRILAETVAADYDLVRQTAQPHYFRVRKQLGNISYRFTRLVLPFSTGEGRVDRLLVAIRPEPNNGVALER
jgi:hypothetical protein